MLIAVYYVAMLLPASDRALEGYLQINARIAGFVLRGLGQDVRVSDVVIRSSRFAVSVRRGCDAVEPSWLFAAAVIAYPAGWRRKRRVLPAGIIALLALNILRIVSLYIIGWWQPRFFPMAHLELWPAAFIIMALALWLSWAGVVAHDPAPAPEKERR